MPDYRFADYLRPQSGLTAKFRKIANDPKVVIYESIMVEKDSRGRDEPKKMLVLHYKGRHCMELKHGNSTRSYQEVRDHFKHLRTSERYRYVHKDYAKQLERKETHLRGEQMDLAKGMAEKLMIDELGHGPRSVVIEKKI